MIYACMYPSDNHGPIEKWTTESPCVNRLLTLFLQIPKFSEFPGRQEKRPHSTPTHVQPLFALMSCFSCGRGIRGYSSYELNHLIPMWALGRFVVLVCMRARAYQVYPQNRPASDKSLASPLTMKMSSGQKTIEAPSVSRLGGQALSALTPNAVEQRPNGPWRARSGSGLYKCPTEIWFSHADSDLVM